MSLKVGVVYPQIEMKGDPRALRHFARTVEELGFDYLTLYDHVLGAVGDDRDPPLPGPYREKDPFHDPLIAFSHLAALTERLEFCTGVMVTPMRQTALVARQVADLDLMSGGRFSLGVGVGWNHVEYQALGMDFGTRGDRLNEQIELLRLLWSGDVLDYHGKYDRIDRAALVPAPAGRIPILVGGLSTPAYRRGAKLGDGFIFSVGLEEVALPGWREVREFMEKEERDAAGFRAEYLAMHNDQRGMDVPDLLKAFEIWEANGGTHAGVITMYMGFESLDEHLQHVEKVARALGLTT